MLKLSKSGVLRILEADVQASITGLLQCYGWLPLRIQCGVFLSMDGRRKIRVGAIVNGPQTGMPDLQFAKHEFGDGQRDGEAWLIFVETKTVDGRLSADQKLTHAYLRKLGFTVLVWRKYEDAAKWLREQAR